MTSRNNLVDHQDGIDDGLLNVNTILNTRTMKLLRVMAYIKHPVNERLNEDYAEYENIFGTVKQAVRIRSTPI